MKSIFWAMRPHLVDGWVNAFNFNGECGFGPVYGTRDEAVRVSPGKKPNLMARIRIIPKPGYEWMRLA